MRFVNITNSTFCSLEGAAASWSVCSSTDRAVRVLGQDTLLSQCLSPPRCICGLLTKCEVIMVGYWPSSFFACLWTETELRSISRKKRTRPISSHLDRTSLVNKDLLYGFRGNFSCRTRAGKIAPSCPLG